MPVPFWRIKQAHEDAQRAVKITLDYDELIGEMHDDTLAGFAGYLQAHDEMDRYASP